MLVKWKRNIPSHALLTLLHVYLPCLNVYTCDIVIKFPKTCIEIPFRTTFVSLYHLIFFPPLPPYWHGICRSVCCRCLSKAGEVFAEHPILLEEPQRIANMDEMPLSASSEKIANGEEKVVYDKYVPFVPGMVTQSLTSDVPSPSNVDTKVTCNFCVHIARWWNQAQERVHSKGRFRRQRVSK